MAGVFFGKSVCNCLEARLEAKGPLIDPAKQVKMVSSLGNIEQQDFGNIRKEQAKMRKDSLKVSSSMCTLNLLLAFIHFFGLFDSAFITWLCGGQEGS